MKKKILLTIGLIVALLASAVAVLYLTVDAETFRGFVEDRVETALDRDVELGELHLSVFPVIGLRVDDVSVAADPADGGGEILGVRRMDVGARLLPLLSKRLEITSVVLVEPSLRLERDRQGRWNIDLGGETEETSAGDGEPDPPDTDAGLTIDSVRVTGGRFSFHDASRSEGGPVEVDLTELDAVLSGLGDDSLQIAVSGGRLRLVDDRLGPEPIDLVLDDADLAFTPGSGDQPADLRFDLGLGGEADGARVAVQGQVGGVGVGSATLRIEIEDLPLAFLRPVLPSMVEKNARAGKGDLVLDITGSLPEQFSAKGDLRVADMEIELVGEKKIDAQLELDADVSGGGALIELRTFDVSMGANTLGVTGTIGDSPEGRRVDLTLEPTRVDASDLSFLMALGAPDLGLSMTGASPVEIEGGVRGLITDHQVPEIRGRMVFSGITVEMAALSRPITDLDAEVVLAGSTVDVLGLAARVGDNDLAGTIKIVAADVPTVDFDLRSEHASLDELLELMTGDEGEDAAEGGPPESESFLDRGVAQGSLRVAEGSWANLSFHNLDAGLLLADGVATLDPVSMELYDGRFRGRLVGDLTTAPPSFEFSGDVAQIDVAPFLADQVDGGDLLAGRLTGRVAGRGAGAEPEAIIRSLQGEGMADIADGKIGKLDVLASVGQVAGILGQRTLANLATTMTTDATQFSQMTGKFNMEGGRFRFEDLLLESAVFSLGGEGDVDLVSSLLNGAFQIQFSPEVSTWMKQEGSRAAELFWDAESGRVIVPLGLSGPFASASASVDWTAAATGLVQRTVEKELTNLLGNALGGSRSGSSEEPTGGSPVESAGPSGQDSEKPTRTAAAPAALRGESPSGKFAIEVTKTSWGGSFLAQDFKIEGRVSGTGVTGGRIVVVDASGSELQRKDITNYTRQPGTDEILFKTRADGKKLVLAGFPVTVTLTAIGADGEIAEVNLEVSR